MLSADALQADGRAELTVNGARLIADVSGALHWPAADALIIADLHFEKASAYAARGVALPPYDTAATLARLEAVLAAYHPAMLISLGDTFHDDYWAQRMSGPDKARLQKLAAAHQTIWVTGNHDPTPPSGLAGTAVRSLRLSHDGSLVLRHEPTPRAAVDFEAGELAGHLHPCGKIRQRGRNLRRRCFIADASRAVLPAFGALTGSLNVRDAAFDPLFDKQDYQVILLGESRVARIDAKRLLPDRRHN